MKITKVEAQVLRCLGGKLEYATSDPDPKALQKLTTEYCCKDCKDLKFCAKVFNTISLS